MKRVRIAFLILLVVVVATATAKQPARRAFPQPNASAAGAMQFAGTWKGTYSSSVVPPTTVTLIFQQFGTTVTGTYLSANGAQGVMSGTASSTGLVATAKQTTPTCTGSFDMNGRVSGTTFTWTFNGTDCLGVEKGNGTATKQ